MLDNGNRGAPQMILLHSMRDHALGMEGIAEEFSDYHVIVPDLRGHGNSDNPGSYAMGQFVADLRAVTSHYSAQRPVLVGHSLGGQVCWRYSAIYPDSVSRLILIDGLGPPPLGEPSSARDRRRWRARIDALLDDSPARGAMADLQAAEQRLIRGNPGLNASWARRLAARGVERDGHGQVRWKWDPRIVMVFASLLGEQPERMYPLIECPVQIIMGEHALEGYWAKVQRSLAGRQGEFDAALEQRRRIFRDAVQMVIPGAGHMVNYDQPQALNHAMREFLSDP